MKAQTEPAQSFDSKEIRTQHHFSCQASTIPLGNGSFFYIQTRFSVKINRCPDQNRAISRPLVKINSPCGECYRVISQAGRLTSTQHIRVRNLEKIRPKTLNEIENVWNRHHFANTQGQFMSLPLDKERTDKIVVQCG